MGPEQLEPRPSIAGLIEPAVDGHQRFGARPGGQLIRTIFPLYRRPGDQALGPTARLRRAEQRIGALRPYAGAIRRMKKGRMYYNPLRHSII